MSKLKVRFSDRVLAVILAVLMVISLFPVTVLAGSSSVLTTDIGEKTFKVGVPTEFTFTTTANDDAGVMVVGTSDFNNPDAIEKLEYLESKDGKWYEFSGDFGPSTGFPMSDTTSTLRVTFKKSGKYTFTVAMRKVEDGSELCSTEVSVTVNEKDKSTLTTDIGQQNFIVGEPTEFTFTTTANDYAGVNVIGTSDFSDTSAIDKLEYCENGNWYAFSGDFGPSAGFPMSNATSRFRVTFDKGGDYTFTASMKYADGEKRGEVLCSSDEIKFHVKEKYDVAVKKTGNGIVKINETEISDEPFKAVEGTTVNLSVVPDSGWQIFSIFVGGENQTITDAANFTKEIFVKDKDVAIDVTFVKIYTVTVSYDSDKGAVVTAPENAGGKVTVTEGTDVIITATPNSTFRISKVEITGVEDEVLNDNTYNSANPYKKTLKADKDYEVVITFAPLIYNIVIENTINGKVTVNKDTVEYGNSVDVTIETASGYTIDTAEVNGASVYSSIEETKKDNVFTFTIEKATADQNVKVTFKACETTTMQDVSWNADDALRPDNANGLENGTYVFAKDDKVIFSTENQGIRITFDDMTTAGDKDTNKVEILSSKTITKIELRYDFGWHEVLIDENSVNIKLVFDKAEPTVNIKENGEANANGYYNSDVMLTISAKDSGDYSGIASLEYWIDCGGEESEPVTIYTYEDKGEIKADISMDDIKIIAGENNSEFVTVYAKAYDRSGNESKEVSLALKICATAPAVSIKFEDEQPEEAVDTWYNFDRTATITITDRADVFDETAATKGVTSSNGYTLSKWTTDGDSHAATITFNSEGSYDWDYSYTNKADLAATVNKSGKNTDSFKIDKTAPEGTIAAQSAAWDGNGFDWSMLLEKITFGLYSNEAVSVGLVGDEGSDLLSGFQKVEYYVSDSDEALAESDLIELYTSGKFESGRVVIESEQQFAVYARIVDNAGNVKYIGTNGVIYDVSVSDIQIDFVDKPNENSIYGTHEVKTYSTKDGEVLGIKADITVSDLNKDNNTYSGIKEIKYTVSVDGSVKQSGILFEFDIENPEKKDLVVDWTGEVILDTAKILGNNPEIQYARGIELEIVVTDNAGNENPKSVTINEINLDTVKAFVTMDDKAVTLADGYGWFNPEHTNQQRKAYITFKDSAFNADAATAAIKVYRNGEPVDLATDGDVTLSTWSGANSATLTFIADGQYSWDIDYTNDAGNELSEENISYEDSVSPKSFTIDTADPHGSVTVGEYTWIDNVLKVLTFGIYSKEDFTVSVEANDMDNISPVTVEYYKHDGANALNSGDLDALYNDGSFSEEEPELSGEQQFTLYVRITDNAGNYIYVSSDGHVIDDTQTSVTVEAIEQPNENGIYGKDEVSNEYADIANGIKVAVSAKEADSTDDSYSGIKEIRYEVKSRNSEQEEYAVTQSGILYKFDYTRTFGDNSNGGKLIITDANKDEVFEAVVEEVPTKDMLRRDWAGCIIVDADKNNKCDVVVVVYVTDNAGNENSATTTLDIDITSPEISVEYNNNNVLNDKYFNASRTATVVITERSNHFNADNATAGIEITAKDVNGKDVESAYTISGWTPSENKADPDKSTHTATIFFEKDANYTFGIAYTDEAGNSNEPVNTGSSKAPFDFVVDTVDPEGTVTVNDYTWSKFLETITFGLFSKTGATVSATADDDTSPVKIEYYKSNSDFGMQKVDLDSLELIATGDYEIGKNEKSFDITSDEQFSVYVKITDKAGHILLINSDGYIVDTQKSTVSVYTVDEANENNIYGIEDVKEYEVGSETVKGVKLHIDANDLDDVYSGIASIKYEVTAELEGQTVKTQEGTLYSFDYTRDSGENSNGGNLTITDVNTATDPKSGKVPAKSDLLTEWSGDIIVDADKNNSSNVVATVTVTDNAGNIASDTVTLDIDINTPIIEVSFDNNTALNEKYFNAPRTATIVITERSDHFDAVAATKGIEITAVDAEGEKVEDAYSIIGWTDEAHGKNPDKSTHTATVEFKKDANYTFDISYAGKSANPNVEVKYSDDSIATNEFTVDTTVPDATITINDHIWDKLLNVLTFGLYSRIKADVKVEATDKTSPVTIEYYKTNDPIAKTASFLDEQEFTPYAPFTVNANEQFVVYVKVTDNAGNYKYISTDGYIVDLAAPELTLTPEEPNANNVYNKDVTINIDTSDAETYSGISKVEYWVLKDGEETQRQTLFSFDYTCEEGENCNEGSLTITDWSSGEEKITNLTGNVPTQAQLVSAWNGSFVVNSALNNSSNVKVYVGVTDNAGNYTEKNDVSLDIDITAPSIKVTYDSTANANAKDGYYTSRTATVEITERTNHFDAVAATNGIEITAVDAKGSVVENAYTISTWTTTEGATPDEAVHTATISYAADANYTFAISYTDKADNKNKTVDVSGQANPYEFTVDATAPEGTVTAKSAEGRTETWSSVVDVLTFGFWSNTKISVSSTSDDATSPIASVEYYMPVSEIASDNTTVLKKAELDKITDWQSFNGFDVTANTQFTVYIKITDYAGNYTYISTNGLIVDEEHPVEESVAPEISVSPAKPVNGIYSDDVKVSIEVTDPMVGGTYSGLKEVSYKVFDRDSKTPDFPTQEGTLFTFDMAYPKQSDLQQTWKGDITVSSAKNNSNNIQIVVYATDNSLNAVDNSQKESKSYTVIKIDTTAPVIDIAYDNNNADSGSYFKANRTATVKITERNFNADDVKITITNTDGVIPAVVGWTNTVGTYSKDDATHTATITYNADGDYTFAIEYTDLAGNRCSSVNYAEGTVAGAAFTVDKTIPTVSVSYDNNSALNTNYYKESRTATIVINEHNFSTDRINIMMTATDDGSTVSVPAVNGWSTKGDVHTATISFVNDALYNFDIAYTDLAGNASADYAQDTFYVDKIAPTLEITGVENMSANNGDVIPVITYSDTNYDSSQVKITLVGANRNEVSPIGSYSDIHNGRVFTFANFEEKKEVDDIYTLYATLTDKAGNSTSDSISFSVNRFGSTYSMDENTKNMNNAYVQEAKDVVITEVNANALSNIKILLFKNNETITLKEDTDYKIDVTGGNGKWYQYVYTIFKSNFTDDGVYRLSIHSEDAAGNVAENTLDTKETEINFGVDKTVPTININNLESGKTYSLDSMTVLMSVNDNLNLSKVVVYLDEKEYATWSEEEIEAIIADGGNFSFDIAGDSTDAHTVKVVAVDAAGNEHSEELNDFFVTTNIWVRYYNNKPLFFGSIAGVVAVAGLIVFLVVWKRRKDEKA